jgi:SAM-dependent methyltransferase
MKDSFEQFANNRRTVQSYERYARSYAAAVDQQPSGVDEEGLRRLAESVPRGSTILEVGSGPGWDADFVESFGVSVRRTDITAAFREFQAERGKQVSALDILTDDFGGPYDGVMSLCVLLNIDRDQIDLVLQRVAGSLKPNGTFLVSLREGDEDIWERGEVSGEYYVVLWNEPEFTDRLAAAGMQVEWSGKRVHGDGPWFTILARKIS